MLSVCELGIAGVLEIRPQRFSDERGFFSETWNEDEWRKAGIALRFVQDNHSLSRAPGVLRGFHFQRPPVAQDIRRASPTYGRWVSTTLSSEAWNQLLIPRGFAHGFVTLEPDTEVQYKVTA